MARASILKQLRAFVQRKEKPLMLQAGDTAPEFTVQTHEGKDLSLANLRGKKVLLWFYPKADTPG
ncbi:MAG: redoxin domain-containing protein [Deltaproteobacteria bacterium]|nr:redoxin domain-containing protein [Deltaproteobacteria bacterium]